MKHQISSSFLLPLFFIAANAVVIFQAKSVVALHKPTSYIITNPKSTTITTSSSNTVTTSASARVLTIPRGGDLGPISSDALTKLFCLLVSSDAIAGAIIPRTSMRWFNMDIPKGSLSHKYLHGIGASAATLAVSIFLVTQRPECSLEHALGYGFTARLLSMTLMLLTDEEKKLGMTIPMFGSMWLILAGTVYALFHGSFEALPWAKVVSLVLMFHGLFLFLKPEVFLRKTAISIGPGMFGVFEKQKQKFSC